MSDNSSDAVSEIVGALILTSLIALVIGIIAVGFLSAGTPAYVPAVRIDLVQDGSGNLTLIHRGGDTLLRETTRIDVNGGDRTEFFELQGTSGSWTTWAVGERMVLPGAQPQGSNVSVKIIYTGADSPALLATLDTGTGPIPSPFPTSPTSPPTTVVTTVPTTSPLPTPTPFPQSYDTSLNTNRGGYVKDGGQVTFTVSGSYSWIVIAGSRYDLTPGDALILVINGDSTGVEIDMNNNRISTFQFPDVTVFRNGTYLRRGAVSGIWISQYENLVSSLSIIVPPRSPVWTRLDFNGASIINGQNGQRIEVHQIYPKVSTRFMRLSIQTSNTYYDGGAVSYVVI